MEVSVLTINIAGVQFDWFGDRRKSLIKEIRHLNPDVIFLQETTVITERQYDQTMDIAKESGLGNFIFAPYGNLREYDSPRLGGIGIISRWPFKHVQNRKLPEGKIDKHGARVGLMGSIEVDGMELVLATTHLSWRPEERDLRVAQTENFLEMVNFTDELTIFGGDFNANPEEPALNTIRDQYDDSFGIIHPDDAGITWSKTENTLIKSNWRGDERIDYIFCSKDIDVLEADVVMKTKLPVFPSDHFGLLSRFRIEDLR